MSFIHPLQTHLSNLVTYLTGERQACHRFILLIATVSRISRTRDCSGPCHEQQVFPSIVVCWHCSLVIQSYFNIARIPFEFNLADQRRKLTEKQKSAGLPAGGEKRIKGPWSMSGWPLISLSECFMIKPVITYCTNKTGTKTGYLSGHVWAPFQKNK